MSLLARRPRQAEDAVTRLRSAEDALAAARVLATEIAIGAVERDATRAVPHAAEPSPATEAHPGSAPQMPEPAVSTARLPGLRIGAPALPVPSAAVVPPDPAGGPIRVDCHRALRGPYTGAGSMLRVLLPRIHRIKPGLLLAHATDILSMAPEVQDLCGAPVETLTSLAAPAERTRIYPANRTRRLAHGVVELLSGYAAEPGAGPLDYLRRSLGLDAGSLADAAAETAGGH